MRVLQTRFPYRASGTSGIAVETRLLFDREAASLRLGELCLGRESHSWSKHFLWLICGCLQSSVVLEQILTVPKCRGHACDSTCLPCRRAMRASQLLLSNRHDCPPFEQEVSSPALVSTRRQLCKGQGRSTATCTLATDSTSATKAAIKCLNALHQTAARRSARLVPRPGPSELHLQQGIPAQPSLVLPSPLQLGAPF